MTSPQDREQDIARREQELQRREQEIRLREIEAELNQQEIPFYKTMPHNPPENKLQKWANKALKFAKFTGFIVLGIAIIQMGLFFGIWLARIVVAGIIAFIGYKIFLEEKSSQ